MIVLHLSWINSLLIVILTVKEAWSKELYKSGRIEWLLNSDKLAWRNIRPITELESLELSAYQVETWIMSVKRLRLKESTISIRISE